MREIASDEVYKLHNCIETLSKHHNNISTHFKGTFPIKPYKMTLELFKTALDRKPSHIAVIEDNVQIIGFCKVYISDNIGKLDYLVVLEDYRGNGFGKDGS